MQAAPHPFISVILPTFNGERHLPQALDSLSRQRASNVPFEVLAVDDGSQDATVSMLQTAARELPLRVLEGPRQRNWVMSTNAALREARGEFITLLHQDDTYAPSRFAELLKAVRAQAGTAVFAHPSRFIDGSGRRVGLWSPPIAANRVVAPAAWFSRLLVQNNLAVPAVCFRRSLIETEGYFDEALPYAADWDYWLRLAARYNLFLLNEPLACFRVHGDSQTVALARRQEVYEANLRTVLDRHLAGGKAFAVPARTVKMAELGVEVNLWLAARGVGNPSGFAKLLRAIRQAGLVNACSYLVLSRMIPRVVARLRAGRFLAPVRHSD